MSLDKIRQQKKKKMRKRLIFRSVTLAVLVAAVVFALVTNLTKDNDIYKVGDEAPNFELQQVNDNNELESVQLHDFRGKGIMLNFWGTWCAPCEKELPFMEQLYPEYKERGLEIIAVGLDRLESSVDEFVDKYDLTFPIPHDKKRLVQDLYKIGPMPTTYFINPEGEIVEKVEGGLTLERLEGYFNEIVPK